MRSSAFTIIELLVVMGIIAVLAGLGIFGMSIFRQTVVIEQSFASIVSNLRSAQNAARNNISSQVLEEQTGNKLDSVVDGYGIVFDSNINFSLRYCFKNQAFPSDIVDCTGVERESLKPTEFNEVLVFPQDPDRCAGIFFSRGSGDITAIPGPSGVPQNDGECIIVVRHDSGTGPGDRIITVNLEENNISI